MDGVNQEESKGVSEEVKLNAGNISQVSKDKTKMPKSHSNIDDDIFQLSDEEEKGQKEEKKDKEPFADDDNE